MQMNSRKKEEEEEKIDRSKSGLFKMQMSQWISMILQWG